MNSEDFTKILISEPIDDPTSPLIAHGIPIQKEADPITAIEVSNSGYQYQDRSIPLAYGHTATDEYDYKEPGEECAMLGCFLSWIPIVGFITCCVNADAPVHSRREYWAHRACGVASLVSVIVIVLYLTIGESHTSECHGKDCRH